MRADSCGFPMVRWLKIIKYKLSFSALLDSSGEVGTWFDVNAFPTTFVLDKEGRIIGSALGPREWDSQASVALFDYLINN